MAKIRKFTLLVSALMLLFMLAILACTVSKTSTADTVRGDAVTEITANEGEKLSLVNPDGESTKYVILYSAADDLQADSVLAGDLSGLLAAKGVYFRFLPDTAQSTETEFEILVGTTNRQESKDLYNEILAAVKNSDDFAWGYATVGGKVLFTANSQEAFIIGRKDFLDFLEGCNYSPTSGVKNITVMTKQEYRERYKQELLVMLDEFEDSQFNTDRLAGSGNFYKPLINSEGLYLTKNGSYVKDLYESPWYYPADDQHPRYLITSSQIDEIKTILAMGENPDSDYAAIARNFWKLANSTEEEHLWGVFPDKVGSPSGEIYRYDGEMLAMIEAKALAYLITGDEVYAYEAIICIKNAMLSLHYTTDNSMDVYHGPSHVMVTLAAVYDWCYPILTEEDKWHMIWGTAQVLGPQMESGMRYPPTGMNGVNGHGTGPQFLRDWMTMATVFYDEAPDWWEFIAGRYFQEYLPVNNAMFVNGWVSQGTTTYGPLKVHVALWSAYLVYTACGEKNVLTEDARLTMYFLMSHTTPKDYSSDPNEQAWREYYFQTGDGARSPNGSLAGYTECFVAAALYNDPVIYAYAKHVTGNHSLFDMTTALTMTPALQLCFTSMVDYNGEGHRDGVDTIQYFADPGGQMTIREEWDNPDSVAIMMRLMNRTMANHEGKDHGTFQIYYKGLLAGTSGSYKKYGGATHKYYLQATIGHNGLLVFNPMYASENPANSGYYYSGSQEYKKFDTNYASWIENSRMVTTIGADYGYNADGTPKYGYLAGDLTEAYPTKTVEYIARHMLTVFTGDEDFPAIFVTFDQINSFGENFPKSWLLHTIKEPEIDVDNLTATVINGEGKLLVQSLFGADAIMKVGGEGKAYWINGYFKDYNDCGSWDVKTQSFTDENDKGSWVEGKNILDEYTSNDNAKNIWGRVELRSVGSKATDFLTVMAVTDTSNEKSFETVPFETESVYGFTALNKAIVFSKSYELEYKEFSFVTEGKGLRDYYVAGLASGTWRVYVDGVAVATAFSNEEGAIINFTAPTGNVTVKPGNDVVGANGGKINYVTGGATMPENTPYGYNNETATPLPLEGIVRGEDIFLGWYLTETFDEGTEITEIPEGMTGPVTVYARWISTFLNENYSSTVINKKERSETINGVSYSASKKVGASFITKTDVEKDRKYLEWIKGEADPIISQTSTTNNFSTISTPDKCVTYDIAVSANPGSDVMKTQFRIFAKQDVNGKSISATGTEIFKTKNDGKVYAVDGGQEKYLATLSADRITHLRIVMDFKNGQIRYYDENNYYLDSVSFTAPTTTGADDTEQYLKCLTQYLWHWQGNSGADYADSALRIYGIRVREGDRVKMDAPANAIIYSTAGGKIVENAPNGYNTKTGTALPTEVELDYFEFDGWYLTPDFSGEPVTEIGKGQSGPIIVYAKWKVLPNTINYNLDGGTLSGEYPKLYDIENGTDVTSIVPVSTGRVFVGWYTSPTFEEETRVGVIGKGATEPIDIYAKWTYPDGSIVYELNGAEKPLGLPDTFVSGAVTPIPNDITKDCAIFLGWYTTPDFKEGTQVTEIPADQTGFVMLYAKWAVKISENWSETKIDLSDGKSLTSGVVKYSGKGGDSVYTTIDENGEKYLLWKPGTSDPIIAINDKEFAPRYMAESAISYTITVGKSGDAVIPNFEYRLIGKRSVTGASVQSNIYFGKLIDGVFYLGSDKTHPLYNLYEEEKVTVRIVIDFKDTTDDGTVNGTITAYDENGETIETVTFKPSSNSGATTIEEYRQCFDGYLFYSRKTSSGGTLDDAIRYYELTVEEGNKHKKISNDINYVTNGGILPDGAPTEYDSVNGTDISSFAAEKYGYTFDGWYLAPDFSGEPVTEIGKGKSGPVIVYAKWKAMPNTITYNLDGGTLTGDYDKLYDAENGTDITGIVPVWEGHVFVGWYTSPTFEEETRASVIGKGETNPIDVYAKWAVRISENWSETVVDLSDGKSSTEGAVKYSGRSDCVYKTMDENGEKYLLWKPGTSDPIIAINDKELAPRYMSESAISYTFTIGKHGDTVIPNFEYKIMGKVSVTGETIVTSIYLGKLVDGVFYLGSGKTQPLYDLYEEERVTVRIVIDFEDTTDDGKNNGTVTAYDENGEVIGRVTFTPSSDSGAATVEEYRQCFDGYLFYARKSSSGEITDGAIRWYELTVEEGNKHVKTSSAVN